MKKMFFTFLSLLLLATLVKAQGVDTLSIRSRVFNTNRKIKISLPAGFYNNPDQKYIVAYLFDSQSESFFNFYKTTIDYLTGEGYIKPMILVGIASENRQYEFTPIPQTPQGLKDFRKSGGAPSLAAHLLEEVAPLIKQKYHSSDYNVGIGHSLGATFISYCMLNQPGLFNAGIAISPNLEFDNEQLVHKFDSLASGKTLNHKFFYLAHGAGDRMEDKFKEGSGKVNDLLIKKNISGFRYHYKIMDNNSHGTTAMEGIFKGLLALFNELMLPDKQINAFYKDNKDSFIDNVKGWYKKASNWSGLKLPLADDLNNIGYNCFYDGQKDAAVEIFKWCVGLYPGNINLYDSAGEISQLMGDKSGAMAYYTKGLNIVKQQQNSLAPQTYQNLITGFENRIKSLGQ